MHLPSRKSSKGNRILWGDYYIRIGVTPDSNNAVVMQVEHRAIRDMNIALNLIDQLAKKIVTENLQVQLDCRSRLFHARTFNVFIL